MSVANHTVGAETIWRIVFAGFALAGLYLTWVGWVPRRMGLVSHAPRSTPDSSQAA
jgi:hypothetical protein